MTTTDPTPAYAHCPRCELVLECPVHGFAEASSDLEALRRELTEARADRVILEARWEKAERERDEARDAVQAACDVAVTAACEAVERERDEALARAARLEAALVARHGGEPVALLSELDEARARIAELEADRTLLAKAASVTPTEAELKARVAQFESIYPCDRCGTMRTKAEGGTVFTVCDKCWDETTKPSEPAPCATCGGTGRLMDSGPPNHWSAPCPDCDGVVR